jgi:hypothetical protein
LQPRKQRSLLDWTVEKLPSKQSFHLSFTPSVALQMPSSITRRQVRLQNFNVLQRVRISDLVFIFVFKRTGETGP